MPQSFAYRELPTPNLAFEANVEAHAFQLPPDWKEGRPLRRSFAFDEEHTLDHDDGSVIFTFSMELNGELKSSSATAADPAEAKLLAIAAFITDYGLIDRPPSRPRMRKENAYSRIKRLRTTLQQNPDAHPVVVIQKRYADKQRVKYHMNR